MKFSGRILKVGSGLPRARYWKVKDVTLGFDLRLETLFEYNKEFSDTIPTATSLKLDLGQS